MSEPLSAGAWAGGAAQLAKGIRPVRQCARIPKKSTRRVSPSSSPCVLALAVVAEEARCHFPLLAERSSEPARQRRGADLTPQELRESDSVSAYLAIPAA